MHGVKVLGHPAFAGKLNLASQPEATRAAAGKPVAPAVLAGNPNVSDFAFNDPMGKAAPLSVLELCDVKDKNAVNSQAPLELAISQHVPDNEVVMAVAYDEELGLFIPVGGMDRDAAGNATVRIDQLPTPTPAGTRSLGGSIKILFKRVVLEKIGIKSEYPLLQEGVVSADGELLEYKKGKDHVAKRVAESKSIVMFIHGIIGDTKDMTKAIRKAKLEDGRAVSELYDLALTFDYENLGTTIEENGRLLKQRLEEVGLKEGHGKTFHIIAHSMGGLVSRWFIEKEGGNKVVTHLIQLGTPNGGSELGGSPRNWAKMGLTALMGKATVAMPFLAPLSGFLHTFTEAMLVSLGQMAPGSDFMKALNDGTDPGIPYSIIAGNTSLIDKIWGEEFSQKLVKMAAQLQDTLLGALFKENNDVAVRVESIKFVPDNRIHPPKKVVVACDHMSYFADPNGLKVLAETLFEIAKK
jgi:pimeloyl-ACP methyl ester carboxylesterase